MLEEEEHIRRPNAVEMLQSYVSDTLDCFDTVTAFCYTNFKWVLWRETELELIRDIQERASRLNRGFLQVFKSTEKGKAFGEYLRPKSSGTRREELEKELAIVLKNTREGVEKLTCFLDAVEKLAVTSLQVFTGGEEVVKLSLGFSLESVKAMILAARLVCPLLLHFKRDAEVFFTPSLHNVAVFAAELDKYVRTTENICKTIGASFTVGFGHKRRRQPLVEFAEDLTEEDLQNTLAHVEALSSLRRDQDFRLVFLFQEKPVSGFVDQFSECRPRMLQFLDEMEGCAVQLDRMSMGSKISTVAGSSVGALGGILAIVGLALAPVTAGVSLGLTMGGVGLGVTSGVNSVVTTVTEIAVNKAQQERANEGFQSFMEDVERIQVCLDEVTNQREEVVGDDYGHAFEGGAKVVRNVGKIGQGIYDLVDGLDDLGMAVARGPAVLSKAARAGFIGLNAVFLGLDIFLICKDSISLAKGDKSAISQFIRARAALLHSMLDAWQTMHEALLRGLLESKRGRSLLEQPFCSLISDSLSYTQCFIAFEEQRSTQMNKEARKVYLKSIIVVMFVGCFCFFFLWKKTLIL
uniref:Apolipoprotein L n=1 Tax=Gadus morhua TaxID=8049 RepID=A0A8C5C184_GADMO